MNRTIFGRTLSVLSEEGVATLLRKSGRYIWHDLGLQNRYLQARYRLAGNIVSREVNGVSASFTARSFPEYHRHITLMNEREVLQDLLDNLSKNDIFLDVGANIGTYSCFAGQVAASVTTVEPEPQNVRSLKKNLADNAVDAEVYEGVLSNNCGTTELAVLGTEPGEGGHSIVTGAKQIPDTITVPSLCGDKLFEKKNPPTVIKIDVEGSEIQVIEGLENTLSCDDCRLVYCEVHPNGIQDRGREPEEVKILLQSLDFEVEVLTGNENGYSTLRAKKTDSIDGAR